MCRLCRYCKCHVFRWLLCYNCYDNDDDDFDIETYINWPDDTMYGTVEPNKETGDTN